MPFGFDRFESFGHDEFIVISDAQGLLIDVDGIKIFDKDDQVTKH